MTVSLERKTAKELILFRLNYIQETIQSILSKWGESNIDDFLTKVKFGEIEDAEMDAITLKQLSADYKRLHELLLSISPEEPI